MGKLKKQIALLIAAALSVSQIPVTASAPESAAEPVSAESAAEPAATESAAEAAEGQLTMNDLRALNGDDVNICTNGGYVTFVEGTCTETPVTDMEAASRAAESMRQLMGIDGESVLEPWRTLTDTAGNHYYVFQQMYRNTTVQGGAVKIVTDADGVMKGLVSSLASELPEGEESSGELTEKDVEKLVVDYGKEYEKRDLTVIEGLTGKVILPVTMEITAEEDQISHFVWVVYTDNPVAGSHDSYTPDLPYLAHYITLGGTYLYSLPTLLPGDEAGKSGFDASYVFEFMEPAEYTGLVTLSDGTDKKISVTLMRDSRTGTYYLGNLERRIVVGDYASFVYDGEVHLDSSQDNQEWDAVGLLALDNICRAWDYYSEIGWIGADGESTPILILNNLCDEKGKPVNNACYLGRYRGWQAFGISLGNDLAQCLDVLAHEFTHCVTGTVMTYNSYSNDYGAINESMSDIHGKICEMINGDGDTDWVMGSQSLTPVRSMEDPHKFLQPEYTWDLYYTPHVQTPTLINDYGGVHSNSGILNHLAYLFFTEGGMTPEEARDYWFAVDCAMVPGTDYEQLRVLLPWVMEMTGMEEKAPALLRAIDSVRLGENEMPEDLGDDRALLTLTLPDTELFTDGSWALQIMSLDVDRLAETLRTLFDQISGDHLESLPEILQLLIRGPRELKEYISENGILSLAGEIIGAYLDEDAQAGLPESEEAREKEEAMYEELLEWVRDTFGDLLFQTIGSAGQDGQTVQIICRPGRTIPILIHAVVDEKTMLTSDVAIAVYLNGRWYDIGSMAEAAYGAGGDLSELPGNIPEQLFTDLGSALTDVGSPEEIIDLLSVKIEGGKAEVLSSDGLKDIGFMDDEVGAAIIGVSGAQDIEIVRQKSRPLPPESAAEAVEEAGAVDSAEEAVEAADSVAEAADAAA